MWNDAILTNLKGMPGWEHTSKFKQILGREKKYWPKKMLPKKYKSKMKRINNIWRHDKMLVLDGGKNFEICFCSNMWNMNSYIGITLHFLQNSQHFWRLGGFPISSFSAFSICLATFLCVFDWWTGQPPLGGNARILHFDTFCLDWAPPLAGSGTSAEFALAHQVCDRNFRAPPPHPPVSSDDDVLILLWLLEWEVKIPRWLIFFCFFSSGSLKLVDCFAVNGINERKEKETWWFSDSDLWWKYWNIKLTDVLLESWSHPDPWTSLIFISFLGGYFLFQIWSAFNKVKGWYNVASFVHVCACNRWEQPRARKSSAVKFTLTALWVVYFGG